MTPARIIAGGAVALLLALPGAALAAPAAEQCGVCHPQERVAHETGIHARESVGCAGCHGGDVSSLEVERAHRGEFRSLGDRRRLGAACAECHADLAKMRPYNLPVDQYAVYQTSQHGKAVAAGDPRAAVCTDCHGVHDIRSPSDPSSPAHARNVAATCGGCHGDAARMAPYGLSAALLEEYRGSVHGRALLLEGSAAAPSCVDCHGAHGPTPPGVGDVDKVCGSCHAETRRAFLAGPHHEAMLDAGLPECASCHSNHAIQRFEVSGIEALCTDCHGDESEQADLGRKLATLIESAEQEVGKAEEMALAGERAALEVEDYLSRVEEARTYLTEALPAVHAVMLEPVEVFTRRARSIGKEVQHEIASRLDRRAAHIGLAVFWFYLVMTLAILISYKRRVGRGTPPS